MANEIIQYTIPEIERIGQAMAKSGLFGVKSPEQAIALCLIAHAEGRHPALAAKDYDIIQGRPAKKAEAMMRDFISQGGKVEWHELTDEKADATFSHASGGTIRLDWTLERAKKALLTNKDNWGKYTRAMLRSRLISEGVRTVCPAATGHMPTPEEIDDIDIPPMKDVTPPAPKLDEPPPIDEALEKLKQDARDAAGNGNEALTAFWNTLNGEQRKQLVPFGKDIRQIAVESDNKSLEGTAV